MTCSSTTRPLLQKMTPKHSKESSRINKTPPTNKQIHLYSRVKKWGQSVTSDINTDRFNQYSWNQYFCAPCLFPLKMVNSRTGVSKQQPISPVWPPRAKRERLNVVSRNDNDPHFPPQNLNFVNASIENKASWYLHISLHIFQGWIKRSDINMWTFFFFLNKELNLCGVSSFFHMTILHLTFGWMLLITRHKLW